ncbi:unnamed protein product, partial [Mycena citricolor]
CQCHVSLKLPNPVFRHSHDQVLSTPARGAQITQGCRRRVFWDGLTSLSIFHPLNATSSLSPGTGVSLKSPSDPAAANDRINTRVQRELLYSSSWSFDILVHVMVFPLAVAALTEHSNAPEWSPRLRTSISRTCCRRASLTTDLPTRTPRDASNISSSTYTSTNGSTLRPRIQHYSPRDDHSKFQINYCALRQEAMDGERQTTSCRSPNYAAPNSSESTGPLA